MSATDVELPGVLPLVLGRFHHSRWRSGRWFGPSWASTLDQHLRVLDDQVLLAREDAHVVGFPAPGPLPVPAVNDTDLTLSTGPDGLVVDDRRTGRRQHYSGDGEHRWLAAITDPTSTHRVEIDRDDDGTPRVVRHSGGYEVLVVLGDDRVVGYDLATPAGPRALVRFGYTAGNLTAVIDSTDLPTRFGYDDHGRLTGWVDRIGTWFRHEYDADDRVVHQTGSGGALSADYRYDDVARTITRVDALGHAWTFAHDDRHRVVRVVDPLGGIRHTAYDDAGRVVRRVDELGRTDELAYDDAGDLVEIHRPDGAATVIERDARGLPVRVDGPDGSWRRAHDAAGRPTATVGPDGARTLTTYDARGHLATITDPSGAVSRVGTDAAGLVVALTDPLGATTRWERDGLGRVVAESDPLGARTAWTWTTEGRLASTTDPLGSVERRLYDGEGNLVALTDAVGGVRRWEYTHFDLPAVEIAADGARTHYRWDAELRLVTVTNPQGLRWTHERDACGRVVAETDFDGRRRTVERDAAGQVGSTVETSGRRTSLRHDVLGRLVEQRVDGVVHTFGHDAAGRLVRATTPDVDVVLERDDGGRVVVESVNGRAVHTSYDGAGRRVRRDTPAGAVSTWSHDAASRVVGLAAGLEIGFSHDAAGREVRRVVGAMVLQQEWDAGGRLAAQRCGPVDRSFAYRRDGHLVASGSRSFDLDGTGRVTAVRDARGRSEDYAYDPAGNLVGAGWAGADPDVVGERTYDGTRVRRAGRITYSHDTAGRLVRRTRRRLSHRPETWHYRWDGFDRLVETTTPDGSRWRYLHDAFGRRVAKQRVDDGGVVEQVDFTWDGATLVEQVARTPDGDVIATTWDHDESGLRPIAQRDRIRRAGQDEIDERFHAIVTDLVGAPTEMLDSAGVVVGAARRSLWGRTVWTGGASTPLLFPGQYADAETGLVYNLHRHYDPDTARYASPDPLGLAPAPNPVTYVHNPHTWVDPLGLNPCQPDGGGGGRPNAPRWDGDLPDTTTLRDNAVLPHSSHGLDKAGRSLQKKIGNDPHLWPGRTPAHGDAAGWNEQAHRFLDEVLSRSDTTVIRDRGRHHGTVVDTVTYRLPNERGVRWTKNGEFVGFV